MTPRHDHQRTAGRRAWEGPVLAAGSAPHSFVDPHQNRSPVILSARHSSTRTISRPALHCRGLHCATAFSIHVRARLAPSGAAPRRHVCILPNGRAATHSYAARGGLHRSRCFAASGFVPIRRCALARGPQFCLPEHSTRQSSDALEGHFSTSLSGLSFQHRNDDTPERPKSWKRQPIRTAP